MNPDIDNGIVVESTEEIGSLIRLVRKEQGIKQVVAAGLFGSGNRFISEAENGKKNPSGAKAHRSYEHGRPRSGCQKEASPCVTRVFF